jgi:putative flippase GtrA
MTPTHRYSISWFAVIGVLAAGVHYVVAVSLELTHVLNAIYANTAGFLCAFPVSYFGHRKLSFSGQISSHLQCYLLYECSILVSAWSCNGHCCGFYLLFEPLLGI